MKKGPLAEAQVVACLQEHGWPYAERRVMGGRNDRGDVSGVPGVVVEVKSQVALDLAGWLSEAEVERENLCHETGRTVHAAAKCPVVAVVWHKRRGKGSPLDWYVTMTGRDFLALLTEYTREA